jgi:hypothetical protein
MPLSSQTNNTGSERPWKAEGSGTVVQQSRIRRPEGSRDDGVPFVPGRSDRVEALALRAKPSGNQIQVPTAQLRIEQVQGLLHGQARPCLDGPVVIDQPWTRRSGHSGDGGGEVIIDLFGHESGS